MTFDTIILLVVSGFAAGVLNAVAGGGTFITFPALIFTGVPPIAANATATVAALPGYLASAYAYRGSIAEEGVLKIRTILLIALAGGLIGAVLLMVTPSELFSGLVPWLLLVATVLFAVGPWLVKRLQKAGIGAAGPALSIFAFGVVSTYGGYFNGGLGIILLATMGLIGFTNLDGMNGLKNLMSAVISVISAAVLALAGLIWWPQALVMAVAATAGGFFGGWAAQRITNKGLLRAGIVMVGLVMTVIFFVRQ